MKLPKSPYEQSVSKLFDNARVKKYPKNQIVFYQGDPLSNVCLLDKGVIKAYTILDSGDTRTMFLLGPGDIFPIALLMDLDWSSYSIKYFYQTLTEVDVRMVETEAFKRSIESSKDLMNIYLSYMGATNEAIINQLEMMKTKGAINKVAFLLPYLVRKLGSPIKENIYKLNLKLSHQEIADLTGLTRETTTQQVKKLEKDGAIQQKKGTWIIKLDEEEEDLLRG